MQADLLQDLATLVAHDTVSHRPNDGLAGWLADRLDRLGYAVRLVSSGPGKVNVVASAGPVGTDGLVLSGHLDVVPTEGQPWSSDPFVLTERDAKLYGRGTADMKGFIAASLAALTEVRPGTLRRELLMVWTCDEEVGCHGSRAVADALLAEARPVPSACLIGEPTDFRVLRAHPGHAAITLSLRGQAAHSSRPELGRNAIEAAAEAVLALRGLAERLRAEPDSRFDLPSPWVALNVAQIVGGAAINIVPDAAEVQVGVRPLPGMAAEEVYRRVLAAAEHAVCGTGCTLHGHLGPVVPSLHTPAGTALAGLLAPHAAPGVETAPFATDGGHLARLGCAPLIFGPGSIDVAHQADEHVAIEALVRTPPILASLIHRRCVADI